MITVLQALKDATNEAGIKELAFANLNEAQAFIDSFTFVQYPINIVLPPTFNGTSNRNTGFRKAIVPLQGWVLTRLSEDPNDYRSVKVEDKYVTPMRDLAMKFIKAILSSEVTNMEVQSVTDTIKPEYYFLNQHTIGVSYTLNWPVNQDVC